MKILDVLMSSSLVEHWRRTTCLSEATTNETVKIRAVELVCIGITRAPRFRQIVTLKAASRRS